MTPEQFRRVEELYFEVLKLPAEKREEWLASTCQDDEVVRTEVAQLLAQREKTASFGPVREEVARAARGEQDDRGDLAEGTRIGSFRILHKVGEGGMGVVYEAEQIEPVRRRVALKLIKIGMDTKEVLARFESERQALALMSHANIARVLDAGITEQGRPYFVMEFVAGVPITEHCDQHQLSIEKRLDLFMDVCEAIQHAHQKGIIHRDLKANNVLVAHADGRPTPKVIDFGVAKAINQRLTERTLFTELGKIIGTPEYMSPEQAEMADQDVDTRTDIYSLGVLLYELLTGALPFDPKSLRSAGDAEMQRIIREVDPPKPSTRLSSLGTSDVEAVTRAAEFRRSDLRTLARRIRGDLDWIVMRCLEKDRCRRYESAHALVEDLQRHLRNEPILAGPPSVSYRLSKFVRRNRASVAAACVIVAGLLAGIVGIGVGWVRAEAQRAEAGRQAEIAEAVIEFLEHDMLGDAANRRPPGSEAQYVTLPELLDRSNERIRPRFADSPVVEARVRRIFGLTYLAVRQPEKAADALRTALILREETLGEASIEALEVRNELAVAMDRLDRPDEAEALCRKSLELQTETWGEAHLNTARAYNDLASYYVNKSDYRTAEPFARRAWEIRGNLLAEGEPDRVAAANSLGQALLGNGKYVEAIPFCRIAASGYQQAYGDNSYWPMLALNNLAYAHWSAGNVEEAARFYRELLDRSRSPDAQADYEWQALNALGELSYHLGQPEASEEYYREIVGLLTRTRGIQDSFTQLEMWKLGYLLERVNKLAEAEEVRRELLDVRREVLPQGHSDTAVSLEDLGRTLVKMGRHAEAEPLIRECLQIRKDILPEDHWAIASAMSLLGESLAGQARFEEAELLLLNSYAAMRADPQAWESRKRNALDRVINLYEAWGKPEKAAEWRGKAATTQPSE